MLLFIFKVLKNVKHLSETFRVIFSTNANMMFSVKLTLHFVNPIRNSAHK